jgi:hypothetical protein
MARYAGLPLSLPAFIYKYFFPEPAGVEPMFVNLSGDGFWLFLMVGNFILYFLLVYLGFWWKQRPSMPRLR